MEIYGVRRKRGEKRRVRDVKRELIVVRWSFIEERE